MRTSKERYGKCARWFFSSPRLQQDWKAAEPNPELLTNAEMDYFLEKLRLYYKHSENQIIQNFEFWQIANCSNETLSAFYNHVEAAGKTCTFCG